MKLGSPLPPTTGFGRRLTCPKCGRDLALIEIRDQDQAYWCYSCDRGWRAGAVPLDAYAARVSRQAS